MVPCSPLVAVLNDKLHVLVSDLPIHSRASSELLAECSTSLVIHYNLILWSITFVF